MRLTEEEANLILAAVYNMKLEQMIQSKRYCEQGFVYAEDRFIKLYCKYNNLYKKLFNELADITE